MLCSGPSLRILSLREIYSWLWAAQVTTTQWWVAWTWHYIAHTSRERDVNAGCSHAPSLKVPHAALRSAQGPLSSRLAPSFPTSAQDSRSLEHLSFRFPAGLIAAVVRKHSKERFIGYLLGIGLHEFWQRWTPITRYTTFPLSDKDSYGHKLPPSFPRTDKACFAFLKAFVFAFIMSYLFTFGTLDLISILKC